MTTFRFRRAGPSGRGEGRIRYLVDDALTFRFLGAVEGKGKSWTADTGRLGPVYKSRQEAAEALPPPRKVEVVKNRRGEDED